MRDRHARQAHRAFGKFPRYRLAGGLRRRGFLLFLPTSGYTLKHTHGGPTYVYVISGYIQITDNKGTVTYCAGSFFSEPPGHVHTLHVVDPSEIFVLQFLPPGADATIPVQ